VQTQLDPRYSNALRGFFMVYLTSFNEWHEGHQFEPAKRWRRRTEQEQAAGCHNARNGYARFRTLKKALHKLVYA